MVRYNEFAGKRFQRIEALSDGVIAIAMTILVFDLKLPVAQAFTTDDELFGALRTLAPKLVTYVLSFLTLGIFWTGQGAQFHFMGSYDRHLNWMSILFLMFVSVVPFTTGILSQDLTLRSAVVIYWLNILLLGLSLAVHWRYAYRNGHLNVMGAEAEAANAAVMHRIRTAQLLYFGAMCLCFVNTYLSIGAIIAVQLYYVLGLRHRPAHRA